MAKISQEFSVSNKPIEVVSLLDFGADDSGVTSSSAAIIEALATGLPIYCPPGDYLITGNAIVFPGGTHLYGPTPSLQGPQTRFLRGSGDFGSFFETDETVSSFSGIVLENFTITGGSSATFSNVANKWAIQSHYPFTQIRNIHIEHNSDFFGNGVRIHNDGDIASMGGFSSELKNIRFVGTTGLPADNNQIGFDLAFSGGQIIMERLSATRCDIGAWIRSGEDLEMINCNFDNIRGGAPTTQTEAAIIVGEANTRKRVKGFSFTGYIEGVQRAFVLQNCEQVKIGGYLNALRAFNPTGTIDGFIYINKTAKNVTIVGADVETQYATQSVVYSESVYSVEGSRLFRNITDVNGVPQSRPAGNVFGGTLPARENVQAFRLSSTDETSQAINTLSASGSLVNVLITSHGFVTGDYIWLEGAGGMTEANKLTWQVTRIDDDNFTLNGSLFTGTYTSGGNIWTITTSNDGGEINRQVTYDPPSLADGGGTTTTVSSPGAVLGDYAQSSFSLDLQGITVTSWVSAANVVSVRFQNETTGTLDLASGTLSVRVTKPTAIV